MSRGPVGFRIVAEPRVFRWGMLVAGLDKWGIRWAGRLYRNGLASPDLARQILGVSRVTIHNMVTDGRLVAERRRGKGGYGRAISVASLIDRYLHDARQ